MAIPQKIAGKKREIKGKGYLHEMKRKDFIPGVVYGKELGNMPLFLGKRELTRTFAVHGSRGLFTLEIEGEPSPLMVLVRELQRNALSGQINHVDFLTVNMNEKINSSVVIHIIGEEEMVKKGGILQLGAKEVEVSCMPQDIPEKFECDVASLAIGAKITVGDLNVPDGVEILSEPDSLIVTALAPSKGTGEEEAETAEGDEAAEGETKAE